MGFLGSATLSRAKLQGWIEEYDLNTFIETGLQKGLSLSFMMSLGTLEKYISIDINYKYIENAKLLGLEQREIEDLHNSPCIRKPLDDSVLLLHGSSVDMIPAAIEAAEGNILWWLDAHLPHLKGRWAGRDEPVGYDEILEPGVAFPLEGELNAMLACRDISKDVILCDDMRVYDHNTYKAHFKKRGYGDTGSSDFIQRALEPTHIITKVQADSRYLIALPREKDKR